MPFTTGLAEQKRGNDRESQIGQTLGRRKVWIDKSRELVEQNHRRAAAIGNVQLMARSLFVRETERLETRNIFRQAKPWRQRVWRRRQNAAERGASETPNRISSTTRMGSPQLVGYRLQRGFEVRVRCRDYESTKCHRFSSAQDHGPRVQSRTSELCKTGQRRRRIRTTVARWTSHGHSDRPRPPSRPRPRRPLLAIAPTHPIALASYSGQLETSR